MKRLLLLVLILILPCASAIEGLRISVYLDDNLTTGITYTKLFKIENLDHISGITDSINATIRYNITGVKEDVFFIKDLNKYKYANTGEFTPAKAGNYTVCGWIINSSVEDTNQSDDFCCKNISVFGDLNYSSEPDKSSEEEPDKNDSLVRIKNIPDEAKFGDMIDVELEVYKGDTRKYAVYTRIGKISEKTTVHLKGKYSTYNLKIPVLIKPNCNKKYEEGEYVLEVFGLGASDEEEINIYGFNKDMCKKEEIIINNTIVINETKIIKQECPSKEKLFDVARIKCTADLINSRDVYESSNEKAYKLVPILIIAILTLLCVILILKR